METEELQTGNVHQGHNIRRVRRMKGMKQFALADALDMSQQNISRYESMPEIEEAMLQQFAKALGVPVETLKMMEENASTVVFENNSVTNNNNAEGTRSTTSNATNAANDVNSANEDSSTNTFNPMEKIVELYERLLREQQEKNAALEQRLQALEQKSEK